MHARVGSHRRQSPQGALPWRLRLAAARDRAGGGRLGGRGGEATRVARRDDAGAGACILDHLLLSFPLVQQLLLCDK